MNELAEARLQELALKYFLHDLSQEESQELVLLVVQKREELHEN